MVRNCRKRERGRRKVNLTGLDVTLHRIQTIESQFQSLMSFGNVQKPSEDFQKILDTSMENKKNPSAASRSEINDWQFHGFQLQIWKMVK